MKTKTITKKMEARKMIQFTSKIINLNKVEPFLNKLASYYNINDNLYGNILVSLNEAVFNAITHGNKENENKYVKVIFFKEKSGISFQVIDEGNGFDFNSIPDPTADENLYNLRGRGVFIMKQLSDKVVFEKNGSIVELHFKI